MFTRQPFCCTHATRLSNLYVPSSSFSLVEAAAAVLSALAPIITAATSIAMMSMVSFSILSGSVLFDDASLHNYHGA